MAGPYDIGGNYQPLSPNFPYFQVLSSPPPIGSTGRSYFDLSLGIGVYANNIWNYASGGSSLTLTTIGTSGVATLVGSTLNIPNYTTTGGITSITGTANQITASTTSGATTLSLPANVHISGTMFVGGTSGLQFGDTGIGGAILGYIVPRSDGVWELGNSAANAITRLMFGPSLTTNPAIVVNGSGLSIKSSDSSLFTAITAGSFIKSGGTSSQYLMADGSVTTATFTNPMTSIGDLIQGTTAGAPARLASIATGNALISGGVTTASSWGKIGLTTHISGILPVANGGTNTATPAIVAGTNTTVSGTWPNQTINAAPASFKMHASVQTGTTLTLDTTAFVWVFSGTTATVWTLPALSGNTDLGYRVKNRGTATITLQRAGSDNLYAAASVTSIIINPGEAYEMVNDGSFWLIL